MGRSPCCAKEGLNRGAWTAMEDKILTDYIKTHGEGKWRNLPKRAGLKRCGKSCRLRWLNYLRPDIKRGNITDDEEELIIRLHKLLGNRWSLIAGRLPGRTDNEIKNYWNTNLSKRIDNDAAAANRFNDTRSTPNHVSNTNTNTTIKKKKKKKSSSTIPTNSKNKTTTILPPSATLPVKRPSSLIDSPNVVRTKAVRCTKVYLVDPLPPVSSVGDSPLKAEVAAASNCNKMVPPAAAAASTGNPLDILLLPSSSPLPCDYQTHSDDLYWISDGMKVPLTTAGSSSDLTSTVAEGDASGLGDMSLDFNFLDLLDSNTYLSDISFDFESGNISSGDNINNNNNH